VLSLGLFWRARDAQARAWALVPGVPALCLLAIAFLSFRYYERYDLPYLAPLCATPALLAAAWPLGSRGRKLAGFFALGLGLAAFFTARQQALPLEQQSAAGNLFDGQRALLEDAQFLEPQGSVLYSSQGALRHMGSWYLGRGWTLVEGPEPLPKEPQVLYAAEREGTAPPAGEPWRPLKVYVGVGPAPYWELYRAQRD
jgi:hypothetical protein